MKYIFTIIIILTAVFGYSQSKISGTITDKNGMTIIGANIYLDGSYDGTISDENGNFDFETNLDGIQKLIISYLGYESKIIENDIATFQNLTIKLRPSAMTMDAVEISASTFKAGDNSKVSVLKPLDIVTTAGSNGDVIAAIQTLPGVQSNPTEGTLLVRGGTARETQIFVDGLKVFVPYSRTIAGTPSRGRYSPFLFKGISFSTGGYSAEFGQALSGILDMNTTDEVNQTETNLSIMTVGLGVGHTQKWGKHSLTLNASYIDLTAYYKLIRSRLNLTNPYRGFSGEAVYRFKTKNGLFKSYISGNRSQINVEQYNLNEQKNDKIAIQNSDIYSNTSYSSILSDNTSLNAGISLGMNRDHFDINTEEIKTTLNGIHTKASLKSIVKEHFIIKYGAEMIYQKDGFSKIELNSTNNIDQHINRVIPATFVESDYYFNAGFAIKLGARVEYNSLLKTTSLSPRVTLAKKISKQSQVSLAAGQFLQEVASEYLFYKTPNLSNEKATHLLLNYNFKNKNHIVRVEGFYKKYDQLLKYQRDEFTFSEINNSGNGHVYGVDLFWKADQWIKFADFWISYSWINNKRRYLDYPDYATPSYSTDHNLSIIGKRWIQKLKSQLSVTYRISSGRPYENPNTSGFMNEQAKSYQDLSMSWSYLISQQKILFISMSNVTGFKNEFGYRYASQPNATGQYNSQLIRPNEDRFFFVGFFITMSKDKTKNQLENL